MVFTTKQPNHRTLNLQYNTMFFTFKKSYKTSGYLNGFTDWHSHILPGVDDGIRTMDDSLAVLDYYESLGMSEVWLTPHIMEDIPNTTDELKKRFEELCKHYKGKLRLHLAAEYMLDNLFIQRLSDGDIQTYGHNGKSVLVETSYIQAPYGFRNILQDIQKAGLSPVLAHPERYQYMNENDYSQLHSQGIHFQMNITSLVGGYGISAQKRAVYLLERGYYSYYGTDVHSLSSVTRLMDKKAITKSELYMLNGIED